MNADKAVDGVDVYYNLHKRLWSCRSRATGRVVQHALVVTTGLGATMVVQEAGRKRVLVEQRKNVHAFARLDCGLCHDDVSEWQAVTGGLKGAVLISYNPYMAGYFYRKDTMAPVTRVKELIMLAPKDKSPCVWAVI